MTTPFQRPTDPKLAKVFDDALHEGLEIRYADESQVVIWKKNQWGCGGILLLILLGIVTAFIVPLVLLIFGALSPSGQVITYTLSPSGSIKKKSRSARR